MRFVFRILVVLMLIISFSCCSKKNKENIEISLIKEHDSLYHIQIKSDSIIDNWPLKYPVYRFQLGDVDENGKEDILVGVIKSTRFDAHIAKRLFIFKNYKGLVRPLWMGSRLGKPLIDFNLVKTLDGIRIRSIEKEKSGAYLVGEYKWRKFGLEFVKYIDREIDSLRAVSLLKKI